MIRKAGTCYWLPRVATLSLGANLHNLSLHLTLFSRSSVLGHVKLSKTTSINLDRCSRYCSFQRELKPQFIVAIASKVYALTLLPLSC